jgi:hypothetical protein
MRASGKLHDYGSFAAPVGIVLMVNELPAPLENHRDSESFLPQAFNDSPIQPISYPMNIFQRCIA